MTLKPDLRVEMLQEAFNEKVGPVLAEACANSGYTVKYRPAEEIGGTVRLHLHVVNQRNWGRFTADIESASPDSFTLRTENHTTYIPAELLPQALGVVKHGILALRITA